MKVSESLVQYALIIHEVVDYPVWKKIFDNAANICKQAGERDILSSSQVSE